MPYDQGVIEWVSEEFSVSKALPHAFELRWSPLPSSVLVYLNGIYQCFSLDSNVVTLAPDVELGEGDVVMVYYGRI